MYICTVTLTLLFINFSTYITEKLMKTNNEMKIFVQHTTIKLSNGYS